jgi:Fe-S-cluster containining protein
VSEPELEVIAHPRFRSVEAAIFTRRLAADCMAHRCTMVDEHREKLDACCQYGCDVDLDERAAILAKADDIRPLLRDDARDLPWFEEAEGIDPDYPSGRCVRTSRVGDGCLFLAHDKRGCAIHRASIERGWDFRGIKPAICRLFPLTYERERIEIAEEYPEYSCAHVDGPTLYRITRDTLGELFGAELVAALDEVEQRVLARQPRMLPVLAPAPASVQR